jgi:PAS domain-containing protein
MAAAGDPRGNLDASSRRAARPRRCRRDAHPGWPDVNGRLYAELFEDSGRNYVFAIIQDIADGDGAAQRSSEQAAIDSYRALFDATVEGIYRSLPDGGFIDVNPALAQMFGFSSPAEMLTAPLKNPEEWYVDSEARANCSNSSIAKAVSSMRYRACIGVTAA